MCDSQDAWYFCNSQDFCITIPRCYKDVYVKSFFPHTARLWNALPIECFPLTYDLSGFMSRINRHLLTEVLYKQISWILNLFVLLVLVTPCLLVVVLPCMEWIQVNPNEKHFVIGLNCGEIYISADFKTARTVKITNHQEKCFSPFRGAITCYSKIIYSGAKNETSYMK